MSETNILITDLRLSEKGMRCIEGIFRAISGPVPGPIEDCENSCLGSIKPFITGIREDIPVQKHINTTNQQCIKQCLAFKIYHNVMCQFGSPENENLQKKCLYSNALEGLYKTPQTPSTELVPNPEYSGKGEMCETTIPNKLQRQ